MSPILLLLLAIGVGACAPRGEQGDSVPAPAPGTGEAVTGTVRIVGSAPVNVQVVIQPAEGTAVRVAGELAREIEQLSGAQVTARGRIQPAPDPLVSRQMEVTSYEVMAVNGRPVVVGEVVAIESGRVRLRTASGGEVILENAPGGLRVGQKIWVQGPSTVSVQSYGVLRP